MIPLFLALSYVLGATPTGYWVGKAFYGVDLRRQGSGNLGATNAFRILGARAAVPVVLVDMAKGWIPVGVFAQAAGVGFAWTLGFGAAAIFGHMFSFWVGFRGGKGVATSAGVFLGLAPLAVLVAFGIWALLTFSTGYVSLGSIVSAVALPPLIAVTPHRGGHGLTMFATALALFVVWAHRANIRRLLRGEENRFRRAPGEAESTHGRSVEGTPGEARSQGDAR